MKNKKLFTATMLMIVYAVLLCQEVVLNQVFCYKDNGRVDLELAAFDIQCSCLSHKHLSHPSFITKAEKCLRFSSQFDFECCCDQLLNSPWLERNLTDNIIDINPIKQYDLIVQNSPGLNEPFRQLPELVRLSKFLFTPLYQNNSAVLRC